MASASVAYLASLEYLLLKLYDNGICQKIIFLAERTNEREFLHVCHPLHGDELWAWRRLDKEDEEYMQNLPRGFPSGSALAKAIEAEVQV